MQDTQEEMGALPTEARHPQTAAFDSLGALGMVQAMHAADQEALAAVELALPQVAAVVEAAVERLRAGGRLLYVGAGTSGRLGVLDASECPPTFHTPPAMVQGLIAGGEHALRHAVEGAEDDAAQGADALRQAQACARDVVVGIAASGRTPYVLGALAYAREAGALTVGMSCVPGSPVACAAELPVTAATGAEVVTGSTRLKAGTATKLLLNMISTCTLAKLGYVHGNLMVNVQPTNAKLRDRAVRIVAELTGLPRAQAAQALADAQGSVKTAIVMRLGEVSLEAAQQRLAKVHGVLREALKG